MPFGASRMPISRLAAAFLPLAAVLVVAGCGGGNDQAPQAEANPEAAPSMSAQAHDQVIDEGWSDEFHATGATEWLGDYVCPEETPYLLDHDYAPLFTELAKGVEIQQNSSPWAINVYAPMYASVPVNPKYSIAWLNDGYLIGLHSWNLHSEENIIVNSVTNWAPVEENQPGNKYKIILHCTDDTSRAAKGKYIPLHEDAATRQQMTKALTAEDARPMTLAQLKAQRPSKK